MTSEDKPHKRDLDGIYIRARTEQGFTPLCLSDCTVEQRERVLKDWEKEALLNTVHHLCDRLREIGYVFDIHGAREDLEEYTDCEPSGGGVRLDADGELKRFHINKDGDLVDD